MFFFKRKFRSQFRSTIRILLALVMLSSIIACDQPMIGPEEPARENVEVWWSEGYYPEETNAIRKFIDEWSEESNVAVDVQFYSEKDLTQKAESVMNSNETLPDIIYGYTLDFSLVPTFAWNGKLVDTSDIIDPVQDLFMPEALESVNYRNDVEDRRSFYAVPIAQNTIYIHYWRSLLEEVGFSEEDIPENWEGFWEFWLEVQSALREEGQEVYALGLPMSTAATDTHYTIEQILQGYDIQMVDENGELTFNDSDLEELTEILSQIKDFYENDYIPSNVTNWTDPDNNISFLSRETLMTPNPTLSIPGSQRQNPSTYKEEMVTIEWPNKVNGEPMEYITSIKQLILPEGAPQTEKAQDLVSYLIQPEHLAEFNEGSQGRFYPVMETILERPFWNDPEDPHVYKTHQYFERTRPSYTVFNPAYAEVEARGVWGNALSRMVEEDVSPRDSAEKAREEIEQIFEEWE